MGYDIIAYFDVDQQRIDNFINENNIDRNDSQQENTIVDYFRQIKPEIMCSIQHINYNWNEHCKLHEFYDYYRTTFIRDDYRFSNKEFTRKMPYCLHNINHSLHNAGDAVEIAKSINAFFTGEDRYLNFADWLRTTSKYCSLYELSC